MTAPTPCKLRRMLNVISLKFGSSAEAERLSFDPGNITVFVGPNNSGKSMVLREIEGYVNSGGQGVHQIVKTIAPRLIKPEDAERLIHEKEITPPEGQVAPTGQTYVHSWGPYLGSNSRWITSQHVYNQLTAAMQGAPYDLLSVLREFVSLFVIRLDGLSRLQLIQQQPAADLLGPTTNHLLAIFQDKDLRKQMRQMTYDAFEEYFVLDAINIGHLRIRLSKREPEDSAEEQNWDDRAREFHSKNSLIDERSDGVKAFTGLTAALLSYDYRVMLIDEPEAFLHPVLARKLGSKVTELALQRDANVFASTHSPEFLMGCVETGNVNVVRLTYKDKVPTARHLSAEGLRQMMKDPLLRSTGVLGGLFHEGVVVGEHDTDRALYQEVNYRLTTDVLGGAQNTLFLNAHEKGTIRRIVQPLRQMGIPAAAIVDLDIIDGKTFNDLLKAAFVPDSLVQSCNVLRSQINAKFKEINVDMKKRGIDVLPKAEKEAAQILLDNVAKYGVFVVPCGELERWFANINRPDRPQKRGWVPWVFELMNTNPELFTIKDEDVWAFMKRVANWVADPDRKGIPD